MVKRLCVLVGSGVVGLSVVVVLFMRVFGEFLLVVVLMQSIVRVVLFERRQAVWGCLNVLIIEF